MNKTFTAAVNYISHIQTGLPAEIQTFINFYIPSNNGNLKIITTRTRFDVNSLEQGFEHLVNLHRINDIRWVNKFFESVNIKLRNGGIFIGCVETYKQRRERINKKYPKWKADIFYGVSFIFNRVLPKLNFTKRSYFFFTKGNNRVISKAETFGRLISCGFEILGNKEINNLLYFAAKKISEPLRDKDPSYGFLIKMKRLGKNGKIINVYKLRTMHPFAEYLQDYVYKNSNIDEGGKFKDDFRVAYWGKIFRRFWIDELPMLFNLLKGDLKFVGIRPLSIHYFSLYPNDYRTRRLKYKPGLVPPYYVHLPKTLDEIIASEMIYLDDYDEHPLLADAKYFFLAFYNILFKGARSR